ncbi:hypothetical protein AAE478_009089 [Parahypoxylon ruwenzoriense]
MLIAHSQRLPTATAIGPSTGRFPTIFHTTSFKSLQIRDRDINKASRVKLSPQQKLLVSSVLDISRIAIRRKPTLKHLSLWSATLPSRIRSQSPPATISMRLNLVGIMREQVINSVIRIHVGQDGKIDKVEDRWNDKLPEGGVSEASFPFSVIPFHPLRNWRERQSIGAGGRLLTRVDGDPSR